MFIKCIYTWRIGGCVYVCSPPCLAHAPTTVVVGGLRHALRSPSSSPQAAHKLEPIPIVVKGQSDPNDEASVHDSFLFDFSVNYEIIFELPTLDIVFVITSVVS